MTEKGEALLHKVMDESRIDLLYFSWIRERIGTGGETVLPPPTLKTVRDLVGWLCDRNQQYLEAFANLYAIRVAVDQEMANFDTSIQGTREIAFFPPVTGG